MVGFSAEDVYGIAEMIRRQRGGAAVVLGALSPRTRNAQVALYQSGDVDFLVATDAIGMGLNMDVDHVAFAAREKFDGARHARLAADEIGQIAGRAGRYMNDGTFGVTGDCEPFDEELVQPGGNPPLRSGAGAAMAQCRAGFSSPSPMLNDSWMRRRRNVAWCAPGPPAMPWR